MKKVQRVKKPFVGQGYAVGGNDENDEDQRRLRAEAAEKRLQDNNHKGTNKQTYQEMERKKKLLDDMERDKQLNGANGGAMKWNMK